ncbi:MAG: PAS domain-containing sensor histidine kinase, partial [Erythrobacter sp.]|nr:PAS domain-containing sensor histidine kinase [Erythrobacter sp.]
NRMTAQLEKQTQALVSANRQIDDRRAFTEAVLESVTAGVISVDANSCVTLMNSSAQTLLASDHADGMLGQSLDGISPELCRLITEGKERAIISHAKGTELLTLAVKVAPGASGGHVITFEDITRQLLDQRQAAWSDVARRIAHEIKNPLTPIQLATERLKRRYRTQVGDEDRDLFDELTSTIVRQVGDLRKMVDEFSSFARLPKPVFRDEDALDLVRQAVFLQEVAHSGIAFSVASSDLVDREVRCDRHQFGQAMTNVL